MPLPTKPSGAWPACLQWRWALEVGCLIPPFAARSYLLAVDVLFLPCYTARAFACLFWWVQHVWIHASHFSNPGDRWPSFPSNVVHMGLEYFPWGTHQYALVGCHLGAPTCGVLVGCYWRQRHHPLSYYDIKNVTAGRSHLIPSQGRTYERVCDSWSREVIQRMCAHSSQGIDSLVIVCPHTFLSGQACVRTYSHEAVQALTRMGVYRLFCLGPLVVGTTLVLSSRHLSSFHVMSSCVTSIRKGIFLSLVPFQRRPQSTSVAIATLLPLAKTERLHPTFIPFLPGRNRTPRGGTRPRLLLSSAGSGSALTPGWRRPLLARRRAGGAGRSTSCTLRTPRGGVSRFPLVERGAASWRRKRRCVFVVQCLVPWRFPATFGSGAGKKGKKEGHQATHRCYFVSNVTCERVNGSWH